MGNRWSTLDVSTAMASRFLPFVVLVSLAATACSASSTSVNVVAGEAPRESAVPDAVSNLDFSPPEGGQFANNVGEYCEQTGDAARGAAGAAEGNIEYSTEFGFLRELSAADRSIQVSVHVSSFDVGAFPLSEDPLAELGDRRAQWERTGPSSYTWALEMRCVCAIDGPIQLSVIDRQPNPRQVLGVQTVEQLFDIIEQSGGADSLQVAYHPDLGYPIEIRIDRYFDGSDDEIYYFVRNFIAR